MGARTEDRLVDDLLLPFVESDNPAESERLLDHLLRSSAAPIIREIVNRKLGFFTGQSLGILRQDVDDVCGDANLRLVARLNALKAGYHDNSIADFKAYVAVTAYNTVNDYLRRRFPRRHGLKNKLRYLMTHDARLSLWRASGGEWACALAAPGPQNSPPRQPDRLLTMESLKNLNLENSRLLNPRPADQLAAILGEAEEPVELDNLVRFVAELWGVTDDRDVEYDAKSGIVPIEDSPAAELEDKLFLRQVWNEILQLPLKQRLALLLNLRDREGLDSISLLPATGIASIPEIAAILDMEPARLGELWKQLPIEDARIAEMLGVTRQQVINLRNAARRRLGRRLYSGRFKVREDTRGNIRGKSSS